MKITPDHLARDAFVYIRQSTTDQLANNHGSRRVNMASPNGPAPSAGRMFRSSMTILAARARESAVRALSGCSRQSVSVGRCRVRIEASRLARNGATGTR
jgi:hypothetical protein